MNKFFFFSIGILSIALAACSHAPAPGTDEGGTSPDNTLTGEVSSPVFDPDTFRYDIGYLMGKFDPASHPDFVRIDPRHANTSTRYLHKDAYAAFRRMYEAARKDNITLTIVSAARNFDYQKGIWESKWNGSRKLDGGEDASAVYPDPVQRARKILEYSSMPGTSRHHWGTDVDLITFNNTYFESGPGKKAYEWLLANAATYGFCQPYTAGRQYGYQEERWHWSYLPLAEPLTALARLQLKDEMIRGFTGAEVTKELKVVEKYVLGINLECLPL